VSSEISFWSGWDIKGGGAKDPHAAEVFAQSEPEGSGDVVHYELLAVAARGFRPPQLLRVAYFSEEAAARQEAESGSDREGFRQLWSLLYRRVVETTAPAITPYAIYLLGVNPPDGATDQELEIFNDFYTNVHLPEVAERRQALRAARYEMLQEIRPPFQGAPRFLATYEVDEPGASNRRHKGPPYTAGPEVWQRHTTPWRLWYRRILTP
jgi:hypothetical protein